MHSWLVFVPLPLKPLGVRNHNQFTSRYDVVLAVFTLAAAEAFRELLQPQADFFKTLNLPEALVHWGHPGNMMVSPLQT